MSLLRLLALDGGLQRALAQGDLQVEGMNEAVATDTTNTNLTITAAMLLNGLLVRNPAGVSNENIDTAANLVNSFGGGNPVANQTKFKVRWINLSANILTVVATANTGLTLVRGNIPVSTFKDFMFNVTNGSLAQSFACTSTNATAVLGGLSQAQCALLTPGMIVTNVVLGLQGTTILGVNIAAGTVTMSGNANATTAAPGIAVNFSPVVTITGLSN